MSLAHTSSESLVTSEQPEQQYRAVCTVLYKYSRCTVPAGTTCHSEAYIVLSVPGIVLLLTVLSTVL